jgi:uncharacterized protein YjiS (DUF1127 family)
MTTQTLQKSPEIIIAENCHTLACRLRARVEALLDALRSHFSRRLALRELRRLDARRLDDIGLGDPQHQRRRFGVYFDTGADGAVELQHRFDIRR